MQPSANIQENKKTEQGTDGTHENNQQSTRRWKIRGEAKHQERKRGRAGAARVKEKNGDMGAEEKHSTRKKNSSKKAALPVLHDVFHCATLAGKALAEDELSQCFLQKAPQTVQRSGKAAYILSVFVRYAILLPVRLFFVFLWALVLGVLVLLLRITRCAGLWNQVVRVSCWYLLKCMNMKVRYRGEKKAVKHVHVFVANHTTYIDYLLISAHRYSHAVVAQVQPGVMTYLLRLVKNSVQFERKVKASKEYARMQINKVTKRGSLLVFPEGTCVNNEYTVMFQKGPFELGVPVYPVAIKYNKSLADPYWNTRKQSFTKHFLYLLSRWRTEATVWWLPETAIRDGETPAEFASRVKGAISDTAGLKNLVWNGYLKHCTSSEQMKKMRLHGGSLRLYRLARS